VDLQGDHAAAGDGRIGFSEVYRFNTVDREPDPQALAAAELDAGVGLLHAVDPVFVSQFEILELAIRRQELVPRRRRATSIRRPARAENTPLTESGRPRVA
jgi:hypothetical protein